MAVYESIVVDDELRQTTRRLFLDGHYAQAVEEACKCVNNVVKNLANQGHLDGAKLMRHVFSLKDPVLKLNGLRTRSEKDQQQGYMDMFAGIMTGVRNPRAHEHAYLDDPATALELLGLANHLIRLVRTAAAN
ncbi:TIGR02391 family protein [Candidatus Poriferisodalis sp.]|uniref:TIGR02391 family protein n=1 Tax=Candidatus Poriferisodalis sp. TaxID=3101277 RepID=UPI003B0133D4